VALTNNGIQEIQEHKYDRLNEKSYTYSHAAPLKDTTLTKKRDGIASPSQGPERKQPTVHIRESDNEVDDSLYKVGAKRRENIRWQLRGTIFDKWTPKTAVRVNQGEGGKAPKSANEADYGVNWARKSPTPIHKTKCHQRKQKVRVTRKWKEKCRDKPEKITQRPCPGKVKSAARERAENEQPVLTVPEGGVSTEKCLWWLSVWAWARFRGKRKPEKFMTSLDGTREMTDRDLKLFVGRRKEGIRWN